MEDNLVLKTGVYILVSRMSYCICTVVAVHLHLLKNIIFYTKKNLKTKKKLLPRHHLH